MRFTTAATLFAAAQAVIFASAAPAPRAAQMPTYNEVQTVLYTVPVIWHVIQSGPYPSQGHIP